MNYDPDKWPCKPPVATLEPGEYDPYGVVPLVNAFAMMEVSHPQVFAQIIANASETKLPLTPPTHPL